MSRYYREEDLIECARTTWCDMYDLDDFLAEVPTADVVPKSEVEKIFEEIEKFNRKPLPECQPVYIIKERELSELKKKYAVKEKGVSCSEN